MKKNLLIGLATGVLILGLVAESKATPFAGKDLHLENWYHGVSQPGYDRVFTVNPIPGAVELTDWGNTVHKLSVNVEDIGPNLATVTITELTFSGRLSTSPNLLFFSSATPSIPLFTMVVLEAASSNWNDPSRVSFTDTTFSYDFGGKLAAPGDFVRFGITTAANAPDPVSEPATLLLFGTGIAGLASARLSRKRPDGIPLL